MPSLPLCGRGGHQFISAIVWTARAAPVFEIHACLTRWARRRICTLSALAIALASTLIFASIFTRFVIAAIILCHPIKREEKIGVWI